MRTRTLVGGLALFGVWVATHGCTPAADGASAEDGGFVDRPSTLPPGPELGAPKRDHPAPVPQVEGLPPGATCMASNECAAGACVEEADAVQRCAQACTNDGDCPPAWRCSYDDRGEFSQRLCRCDGDATTCRGSAGEEPPDACEDCCTPGAIRHCGEYECRPGVQRCGADGNWGSCQGGVDGDCDNLQVIVGDAGVGESQDGGVLPVLTVRENTYIYIFFDSSGSMNASLRPLETMRDTLLKSALLPYYGNQSALYDCRVTVHSYGQERTFDILHRSRGNAALPAEHCNAGLPEYQYPSDASNVLVLWFQDEASSIYHRNSHTSITPPTAQHQTDITALRARLETFPPNFYAGVIFQVNRQQGFRDFLTHVQAGVDAYAAPWGLADKPEVRFRYDVRDGDTPEYYLEQVLDAMAELGFRPGG